MDQENSWTLADCFANTLGLRTDTHDARTAVATIRRALAVLPQPDDWVYFESEDAESTALLLAGDRLVEIHASWERGEPANVSAVSRRLVDGGAVIELTWNGPEVAGQFIRHDTNWDFKFPDGARVLIPGVVTARSDEAGEKLDEGEEFARAVAAALGERYDAPAQRA